MKQVCVLTLYFEIQISNCYRCIVEIIRSTPNDDIGRGDRCRYVAPGDY